MERTDTGDGTDPAWTVAVDGEPRPERVAETLLTLADGRFGTRGAREEDGAGGAPLTLAAGVYDGADVPALLPGPVWTGLRVAPDHRDRRRLDLRAGVLHREWAAGGATLRSLRFASLARPGVVGLRAEGPAGVLDAGPPLLAPGGPAPAATGAADPSGFRQGRIGDAAWASTRARGGGITVAASQHERDGSTRVVERLAVYLADPDRAPAPEAAVAALRAAEAVGFDRLLAEHQAAWAARWADAEVAIQGDPEAELGVRFALFHLLATVADAGEAAVGARGLSGPVYLGHVFWDSDVFILPVLAAVHPPAARAMLEYRVRRLPAARRLAAASGRAGARFPWESAADGGEVTPTTMLDPLGRIMPVHTGELEEHIVADVPWAACRYADWTGDAAFLDGPGRDLLLETARYWASRLRLDEAGRAHIDGVIGPDEYHVDVDDNAFTNVMARWNLRRAAQLVDGAGGRLGEEARQWRRLAGALVDGYDPATGRYQQFAGFDRLEPLLVEELGRPPLAADLLLGRERVGQTQIVKQADVLMLHLLVPEETAPGSLAPNLAFYGPRTTHGSSLSPAVHAALLARAGEPDQALELFRLASRLDLDDLTGTTAGGLHVATFGGVWQALAHGFLGLRPSGGALGVDPRLPAAWEEVTLRLRFHGHGVRVRAGHDRLDLATDGPVRVEVGGLPARTVAPPGASWRRDGTALEANPAWRPKDPDGPCGTGHPAHDRPGAARHACDVAAAPPPATSTTRRRVATMAASNATGRASGAPVYIEEPAFSRWLFGSSQAGWIWLVARLWLGYEWLHSGWEKMTGPGRAAWMENGKALKGFAAGAIAASKEPEHPQVAYGWWVSFLHWVSDNAVWMAKLVAVGEVIIGVALILGLFTGIFAFLGVVLNFSFVFSGSAGVNPAFIIVGLLLVLAWRNAGWYGLDRFLLPRLGTPWHRGELFARTTTGTRTT